MAPPKEAPISNSGVTSPPWNPAPKVNIVSINFFIGSKIVTSPEKPLSISQVLSPSNLYNLNITITNKTAIEDTIALYILFFIFLL